MKDHITMTTSNGNDYTVFAPDELIPELTELNGMVNWEKFNYNDKYYDNNGNPYNVSISENIVDIYEHDIMESPDYDSMDIAAVICSLAMENTDPRIVSQVSDCIYNLFSNAENHYNNSMFRVTYRMLEKLTACNIE